MIFNDKYKTITPFYRIMTTEFILTHNHTRHTSFYNFEYEDNFVKLEKSGVLLIKSGFIFGASGPTFDTKSSREASCVHDALYHLSDHGVFKGKDSKKYRLKADDLLYKICIDNGMWKWRANMWLNALYIFGGTAWGR